MMQYNNHILQIRRIKFQVCSSDHVQHTALSEFYRASRWTYQESKCIYFPPLSENSFCSSTSYMVIPGVDSGYVGSNKIWRFSLRYLFLTVVSTDVEPQSNCGNGIGIRFIPLFQRAVLLYWFLQPGKPESHVPYKIYLYLSEPSAMVTDRQHWLEVITASSLLPHFSTLRVFVVDASASCIRLLPQLQRFGWLCFKPASTFSILL